VHHTTFPLKRFNVKHIQQIYHKIGYISKFLAKMFPVCEGTCSVTILNLVVQHLIFHTCLMLAREENILDLFVEIPVEHLVGTLKESSIASLFFFPW